MLFLYAAAISPGNPCVFETAVKDNLGQYIQRASNSKFCMIDTKLKNASQAPVFADAWEPSVSGRNMFYIGSASGNPYIWTLHSERANIAFADGHVAAMGANELYASPMAVKYTYNGNTTKVTR